MQLPTKLSCNSEAREVLAVKESRTNQLSLKREREESLVLPLKKAKVETEKACNTKVPCAKKRSSSKYRGVCWLKERKAWRARIEISGKREHLGYFSSEKEAALAYDRRARLVSKKKSSLNFPELAEEEKKTMSLNKQLASTITSKSTGLTAMECLTSQACSELNALNASSPFCSYLNFQQQLNLLQLQYCLANSMKPVDWQYPMLNSFDLGLSGSFNAKPSFFPPTDFSKLGCSDLTQVMNPSTVFSQV